MLLALLLGAGNCTGDSEGLAATAESAVCGRLSNLLAWAAMWV